MGNLIGAVPYGSAVDPCCCPPPDCSLFWQTKGPSTATLCGFSEWTGYASSPPKKFKTLTQGGSYTLRLFSDSGCTAPTGAPDTTCTWAGTCSYTVSPCTETMGGTQDCGSGPVTNCGSLGGDFAPGSSEVTTTNTNLQAIVTGHCFSGFGEYYKYTAASQFATLSNEDTEDAAIARANAGIGSWTACTPFSESDCSAYKALRGAGVFDLSYRSAQVQYYADGTIEGALYQTTINLQRRLQGTADPFVDWATITDEFTGPAGTNYTSGWFDLPCASGYEVAANACSIVPL